jgi:3-oxoadipate enol-lactonase
MPDVDLRSARLSYDVLGDIAGGGSAGTTPFVWGHGLTSSRADEDAFPLIDSAVIAEHRQVLRYDARGHGTSSNLATPAEGDWAALALDQIALIDHVGWEQLALGGASMGTATALHAALALGDRVRALVLVIPPTAWETRAGQVDLYEQMAQAVEEHGTGVLEAGARATPPPEPFADDSTWLDRRLAVLSGSDPARLAAAFRGAGTADLPAPDLLTTITAPALVLGWTGDPGHPTSTAERLGELLPNSEVVISSTRDDLDTWTTRCASFLDLQ